MKREYLLWVMLFLTLATTYVYVKDKNFTFSENKQGIEDIIVENNSDLKYAIYAKYPQFKNLSNKDAQTQINLSLKKIVSEQIIKFKEEVTLLRNTSNLKNFLFISYVYRPTNNSIVSIPISVSSYTGKYRSQTYVLTFNYDVLANKELALKDLFQKSSNYLQTLSEISSNNLKRQLNNPSFWFKIEQGTKPIEKNFQVFSLSSDTLFLFFNSPQVAPEKERTRVVTIPYRDIRTLLSEQYTFKY